MRALTLAILLTWYGLSAWAAPRQYVLDAPRSLVVFTWFLGDDPVRGSMSVRQADLQIDFDQVANSTIDVALDATQAQAGFAFATQAMKGPKILRVADYPDITFRSTRIRPEGQGAVVEGELTIRGISRPVTFTAQLYRQRDTQPGDLSRLSVLLKGAVSRSEFGATGWSDMAGDRVEFEVLARIERAR
ncbi:YceI family protein [Actibacterium sp. XHP0104]|uniref:YceI family protein n=1 Tax=Actibacterium sp. XHP0104 TaxID=2984335 RepID=UPI0021E856D3|nr:YceI family protein [Actibacterium sp. XHP0104]MCV2880863.1 YceI family protein [Actibacterium sp. XHP0104]